MWYKEYVPYEKTVNITEKKAPTDESIKLYDELLEKAKNSIIAAFRSDNNILNVNIVIFKDHYLYDLKVKYRLIINGKEILGSVDIGLNINIDTDFQKILEIIHEHMSKQIATECLKISYNKGEFGNGR